MPKLPFGKHSGKDIRNVPKEYLEWIMSQPEMLPDMRWDIQQLLDKYNGCRSAVPVAEPTKDSLEVNALIVAEGKLRILRQALKEVRDMTGDPAIIDTVELALKLTEEE